MFLLDSQNKILVFFVLLLTGIFTFPFFCKATVLFEDNFDSYNTGYIQAVGSEKWKSYNNSNSFTVSSSSYFSPSRGLVYGGSASACSKYSPSEMTDFYVSLNAKASGTNGYPIFKLYFWYNNTDTCQDYGENSIGHVAIYTNTDNNLWLYEGGYQWNSGYTKTTGGQFIVQVKSNYTFRVCNSSNNCSSFFTIKSPITGTAISSGRIYYTGIKTGSNVSNFTLDDYKILNESPLIVNGACGSDNGATLSTDPINFCSAGNLITPSYVETATGWSWQCSGLNGGTTASCSATFGNTPNSGSCGSDNGATLSTDPINFCSTGTLVYPTFITTATGWSWDCAGSSGGSIAHCKASKSESIINYPTAPTEEDCSTYTIPDIWFCQIGNTIRSIFFPSASKLEELNQTYNAIGNKAPFNYINTLKYQIENLNIQDGDITMTLLGSTGTISLDAWGEVSGGIKRITSLLFSLAFLFWALNYIKHFFK